MVNRPGRVDDVTFEEAIGRHEDRHAIGKRSAGLR
jgi:hypothetical protein